MFFSKDRSSQVKKVKEWCSRNKLPYRELDPESLNKVASSVHHEGFVMVVRPLKRPLVHDWVKSGLKMHQFVLALDRVENSHNVGAILRSCAYFGAAGLLVGLGENATAVNSSLSMASFAFLAIRANCERSWPTLVTSWATIK